MSVKVRLGVGNSFAPVGNQEQFEAIQKQSGSNGGEGGEGGEGDERTQLTGGDGDPQPHHLLCSPIGTSLIGTRHSSGVTTLLLSTLLTIAAGFEHRGTKYMSATGILLFFHVLFHVVLQINQE